MVMNDKGVDTNDLQQNNKKHIALIVSNNQEQLNTISSLLEKTCYIISARDGQESLDIVKSMEEKVRRKISVVICEQRIPVMSGMQLLKELKFFLPRPMHIVLTYKDQKKSIIRAVDEAKIFEFVIKPFDADELELRVKRAIDAFDQQEELAATRLIDDVTGLVNRRYLEYCITRDVARVDRAYQNRLKYKANRSPEASDLIFFKLSIDGIKSIEELYGMDANDMLMKQVADIMRKVFRETDIPVRWDENEFLVLSFYSRRDDAPDMAERLRWSVETRLFEMGMKAQKAVTCSIGFACYPFLKAEPKLLNWKDTVVIADVAHQAALKSGGNNWVGLYSNAKTRAEKVYQDILKDAGDLIAKEELIVKAHSKKSQLSWGKYLGETFS